MIEIYDNPKDEAYRSLIDYAVKKCTKFVLVEVKDISSSSNVKKVLTALEPYIINKIRSNKWPGTRSGSNNNLVYTYEFNEKSARILKEAANSLFSWAQPNLPEDLSFITEDGKEWLVNIAHEKIATLEIDEEEAKLLSNSINGLFLKGDFNKDLPSIISDAKRHKSEVLHISRFDIKKLPEELWGLTELKKLHIFEGLVNEIPEDIGNLTNLENLTIMVKSLDYIPKAIGKLTKLKRLTINCACQIVKKFSEYKPLGKAALSELPSEIGNLKNLEHFELCCTSIKTLPREIGNLTNLTYLDLSSNSIESLPCELVNLEKLKSIFLSGNGFKDFPIILRQLKNLEFLQLSKNQIETIPHEVISFKKLNYLDLSSNKITNIHKNLSKVESLNILSLNDNPLKKEDIKFLYNNKNLKIT
jgi:Leucine-rich repeat (LRR) protein